MPHEGTPIRDGLKPMRNRMQGTEKNSQRGICRYVSKNFFRNAAVGMKSGFLEVPRKQMQNGDLGRRTFS